MFVYIVIHKPVFAEYAMNFVHTSHAFVYVVMHKPTFVEYVINCIIQVTRVCTL